MTIIMQSLKTEKRCKSAGAREVPCMHAQLLWGSLVGQDKFISSVYRNESLETVSNPERLAKTYLGGGNTGYQRM